jgi:hypothetical protein
MSEQVPKELTGADKDILASYLAPPRLFKGGAEPRCVGLEVELGNLSLDSTLSILARVLGGAALVHSSTQGEVTDTPLGTFKVEFDSKPLQERRYLRLLERMGLELDAATAQFVEDSVLKVAKEFVPVEIVSPPVPWPRLSELDPLWLALREAGAEGTRDSMFYAFGLHLNPELPCADFATTLSYLRAFLVLEDLIIAQADIDLARSLSPFVKPFSIEYKQLVLSPAYEPSWPTFVDDYVRHNPTRNRTLDLLPLFRSIDPDLDLQDRVETWPLVSARPTLHYRLPNCEIAKRGWSPAIDLNRFIQVENLVEDLTLLSVLREDYSAMTSTNRAEPWIQHLQSRLSAPDAKVLVRG